MIVRAAGPAALPLVVVGALVVPVTDAGLLVVVPPAPVVVVPPLPVVVVVLPLAGAEDLAIPQCLNTADEAIAVIRTHHEKWRREQGR